MSYEVRVISDKCKRQSVSDARESAIGLKLSLLFALRDLRGKMLSCHVPRKVHGFFLLPLLFCFGCGLESNESTSLPYYNDTTLTPLWVQADSVDVLVPHHVGSFTLTDQNNQSVTQQAMDGKVSVVDFFFTSCPGLCPKLTRSMLRVQDSLQDYQDVRLFSYSVTPEKDSVPVLKAYAEANGINDAKWHLLTGTHQAIYSAARQSYFADVDTGARAFLHTETLYLLDGDRRIRGIYNGTLATDVSQLIADVRELSDEL